MDYVPLHVRNSVTLETCLRILLSTVHANRVLTPVVDASTCGGMQPGEFTVLRAVCIVPSPLGTIQLKGPCPRGWKTVTRRVNETGTTAAAVLAEVRIATCSHCIRCHLKPLEAHSPCLRCSGGGRRTGRTPLKLNGLLHAGCPPRAGQHGRREDQAFARFRTVDGAAANSQKEEGRRGGAATGWRRSRAAGIAFDSCLAGVGRKSRPPRGPPSGKHRHQTVYIRAEPKPRVGADRTEVS